MPRHVAIIMDGNGRWATQRGMPRSAGHVAGAEAVRAIVRAARAQRLECLTLYAFSAQNWARPHAEVGELMRLLGKFIEDERDELMRNDIRLVTIGRIGSIPPAVRGPLEALVRDTARNESMTLCLALSYGGREAMLDAVHTILDAVQSGDLAAESVGEHTIQAALDTCALPPVDLVIRTSGEQRLSNFLLWESAYSELVFTTRMWPDFDEAELAAALREYARRERRFGRLTSLHA
jgi:undecaprenyl diphosphate synthase